jgi:hypothetical protein
MRGAGDYILDKSHINICCHKLCSRFIVRICMLRANLCLQPVRPVLKQHTGPNQVLFVTCPQLVTGMAQSSILKMDGVGGSETCQTFYRTTRCHIPVTAAGTSKCNSRLTKLPTPRIIFPLDLLLTLYVVKKLLHPPSLRRKFITVLTKVPCP